MIFVNPSMFTGDILIPNLDEKCIQDFEIFKLISKWELEYLEAVLGKCLLDQLLEQMEIKDGDNGKYWRLKEDAENKWQWLVNGRTYEKTDESVIDFMDLSDFGCGCSSGKCKFHSWEGFVTTTKTIIKGEIVEFQESFLAHAIYYNWSYFNESRTTGIGEQKPLAKNSTSIYNPMRRIDAYNHFLSKVTQCSKGGRISLYGFIKEHSESFPDFSGANIKFINIWDV